MVRPLLETTSISVVLADDHHLLRRSLKILLATYPDIEVVGEAQTGQQTIEQVLTLRPQVVVLDITMPDMNGVEACQEISRCAPQTNVLMLTMHESEAYFFQALQAGAAGYLLKKAAPGELHQAIREVSRGNAFVSHELLTALLRACTSGEQPMDASPEESEKTLALLTPRQLHVFKLIVQGHTNQRIADQLGLSIKTVQVHRASIMKRLGLGNVAQLVRFAVRSGFLSLDEEDQ